MSGKNRSTGNPLLLVIGGLALILIAGLFTLLRQPGKGTPTLANGQPNLQTDQQEVDLGDVRLGVTVSAEFDLTNTGDGPLEFKEAPYIEVKEGC